MTERKIWHEFITEAEAETDAAKLRKLAIHAAHELNEAEEELRQLERSLLTEEARDDKAAAELRAAHAARQVVAAQAIRATAKLLPTAIAQARKGKPALLRLILRATK